MKPSAHSIFLMAAVLAAAWVGAGEAHAAPQLLRADVARALTFEAPNASPSWSGSPAGTASLDSAIVHSGRYAGLLARDSSSAEAFSTFSLSIPANFEGDSLELRGWARWEGVTGHVGLWQTQYGHEGVEAFDAMEARHLTGRSDWTELSVTLPLDPQTRTVVLGAVLDGTGRLWVDDLRLFVDGRPFTSVPVIERPPTGLESDHEFDAGSGFTLDRTTPVQADDLALLGRVWGFLKYHHPAVVAGRRHWDYELFRILPAVAHAPSAAAGRNVLAAWVDSLPPDTLPERPLPKADTLALAPDLDWLNDRARLGARLSERLGWIRRHRSGAPRQFYAWPGSANQPDLHGDLPYADLHDPDAGYRLLALFRLWNAIEYWYPDRGLIGEDWPRVLREFVPRLVAAHPPDDYARALMEFIAHIHDSHANLWSGSEYQPPRGTAVAPLLLRFVEGSFVVTGYADSTLGPATGARIGDAIQAIDGIAVDALVARWRPFYGESNEAALHRDLVLNLTRGDSADVRLTVRRSDGRHELRVHRVDAEHLPGRFAAAYHHVRGPACRRVSDDLAYIAIPSLTTAEIDADLHRIEGARCLIVDVRGYPNANLMRALGAHLVHEPTPFVVLSRPDYRNPGAFVWEPPDSLVPAAPTFAGRVAVLVDEMSMSSAEYHALAFRAGRNAVVVGSTTTGADGNVTAVHLPGGHHTDFSGLGVYTPERRTTQRIGIVPDVEAHPTIAGIVAGRDEVIEAAVRHVLGREMTDAERAALRPLPEVVGQ